MRLPGQLKCGVGPVVGRYLSRWKNNPEGPVFVQLHTSMCLQRHSGVRLVVEFDSVRVCV